MRYHVRAPAGIAPVEVERIVPAVASSFGARVAERTALPVPAGAVRLVVAGAGGGDPLVVIATPSHVRVEIADDADAWARARGPAFASRLSELLGDS